LFFLFFWDQPFPSPVVADSFSFCFVSTKQVSIFCFLSVFGGWLLPLCYFPHHCHCLSVFYCQDARCGIVCTCWLSLFFFFLPPWLILLCLLCLFFARVQSRRAGVFFFLLGAIWELAGDWLFFLFYCW